MLLLLQLPDWLHSITPRVHAVCKLCEKLAAPTGWHCAGA
jgi:hypothetical protein